MSVQYRYFRVAKGRHYDRSEKLYKEGDVVKDTSDLTELFPNKFEEITQQQAEALGGKKFRAEEKDENPDKEPEAFSELGRDVTEKFPEAKKAGLKVYRNEYKKYNVVDPDADETKPLNKKPLARDAVADYVELQTA